MINLNDVRQKENEQRKKIEELSVATDYLPIFPKDDYSRTDGHIINIFTNQRYDFESKWYGDIKHLRFSTKFPNYQIDYSKLEALEAKSIENNSIPLLICFFSDRLVVWDVNKCDWKPTKKWVCTNAYGVNYGAKKEYSYQAYLNFTDAIYSNTSITPFN